MRLRRSGCEWSGRFTDAGRGRSPRVTVSPAWRIPDDEVVTMPAPAAHLVHFYSSPEGLATSLSSFFAEPLKRGESVVVVLRPEHRAALEKALADAGVDM